MGEDLILLFDLETLSLRLLSNCPGVVAKVVQWSSHKRNVRDEKHVHVGEVIRGEGERLIRVSRLLEGLAPEQDRTDVGDCVLKDQISSAFVSPIVYVVVFPTFRVEFIRVLSQGAQNSAVLVDGQRLTIG